MSSVAIPQKVATLCGLGFIVLSFAQYQAMILETQQDLKETQGRLEADPVQAARQIDRQTSKQAGRQTDRITNR
ncbi:hypothetical protein E2C01_022538 [Portunus trituberculatus]|uniref:Uncharacterized protein n=1 Tax=Portunus trituberculatus TaxID=210409 RepID=A0A5B7E5N0_PORTR|nr:hypothetical protein [Portunus trituberculatus]